MNQHLNALNCIVKKIYLIFFVGAFFISCRKDSVSLNNIITSSSTNKSVTQKSDGIITVKTGILPPVTQRTFIPLGDSSITEFQIVSSRLILLRRIDFTAPQQFIKCSSIDKIYNFKVFNDTGTMTYYLDNFLTVGTGASLDMNVYYKPINANTSGSVASVKLTHISYITDDNVMHDFYADDVVSQAMCLVYNVPHIQFQNPKGAALQNNFKEIAEVKLSGDTNWVLNELPFNTYASKDYNGSIPKSKLVVKYNGTAVPMTCDSMKVDINGSGQTVFKFTGGFKHTAKSTEVLKVFAPVSGTFINFISTMNPYSSLVWTDGLGTIFSGPKNNNFYKSNAGYASYSYHQ